MSLYHDPAWLLQRYVVERLSAQAIGALVGKADVTILYWLRKHGIERRPSRGYPHTAATRLLMSQNHADVTGTRNPQYGKRGAAAAGFGRVVSTVTRDRLSRAFKGRSRPGMQGDKCPSWRGGRTSLIVRIRTSPAGVAWRVAVFARYKYTCVDCDDARGGNLHAHHLVRLVDLVKAHDLRTLDAALACEPLWDVTNGVTLCEPCHVLRHKEAAT